MTLKPGETAPPSTPTDRGTTPPPPTESTPEAITLDQVRTLMTESHDAFRESIGLSPGQRIDHVVHGTTKKLFGIPDGKSATEHLAESVVAALKPTQEPPPPPKDPPKDGTPPATDPVLLQTITDLSTSVKDLKEDNQRKDAALAERDKVTDVNTMIDSLGIDPKLVASFKSLTNNGLIDGIGKPSIEDGKLVVDTANGKTPFKESIETFLKANPHWQGEHTAPGSAIKTGVPGTALPTEIQTGSDSVEARSTRATQMASHPKEVGEAMDSKINDLAGNIMPGKL